MSSLLRAAIAASLAFVVQYASASAPAPEPPPPPVATKVDPTLVLNPNLPPSTIVADSDAADGTIGVNVNQPGSAARTPGPVSISGTSAPRCTHRPATYGEYPNVVPADSVDIPDPAAQVIRDNNGRPETGWVRTCGTGTANTSFYWAPTNINPIDLIPNALANARTQLTAPTPAINPDATAGGIVNLGMWLAIDDPGTTTARAALAGVWAQVTANVAGIQFDLGNGDTIDCDGLGTPIPDWALDSLDQGPCGYTYPQSSPDDDPYQLTITTNYTVTYTTSTGANGSLAPISRSVTIDYDVDEIQTIGVSN